MVIVDKLKAMRPRTLLMIAALLALALVGSLLYRSGHLGSAQLSALLVGLGCWAIPAYMGIFAVGQVINVPAMVFIVLAPLVFGVTQGFMIAYVGAIVSASVTFCMVRRMRGESGDEAAASGVKWAWMQRVLDGAQRRPILSVAFLRAIMGLSPPLNYALALSPLKARDHLLGTALGMLPFAATITFFGSQV